MNIKEILRKIANGEALSAEEKDFLEKYDPEDDNRIPKSRLNQEIEKRKAAEQKVDELVAKVNELTEKTEKLENGSLSEVEKAKKEAEKELATLKRRAESAEAEREAVKSELSSVQRKAKISEIAQKNNFRDPNYLDYLSKSKELDLSDEGAVAGFIKELVASSPELFKSDARPGSGAKPGAPEAKTTLKQQLDDLLKKPNLTQREAADVIRLEGEINAAEQQKKQT